MNVIVKPLISEKMTRLTEAAAEPKLNRIQRNKGIQLKPATVLSLTSAPTRLR